MTFEILHRETANKVRQLSVMFNTVISLKGDEHGYYAEMFINRKLITISIWVFEHRSLEYIAEQIVHLVCANFETEGSTNDIH